MTRSKFRSSERGTAIVEFAVVLPIFLLIVWATIDFARAFYTSNALSTAVREGARFGAVLAEPETTAGRDLIRAKVAASFVKFGGNAIPTDSIVVTTDTPLTIVTVQVRNYEWSKITPLSIISGVKKITRTSTFRWERDTTP